ncbi:unnamed protein product [Orchesella dallaii]|uniref:C2H2-type domain-containing protein n=1 Tax=Orchesella dallaii TaxID=48710 RepID=A0ABP1S2A3_9HEXA
MKIHINEPVHPFKCSICIKAFTTQENLDEHINITHTTIQTLQCKLCGEVCQGRKGLEYHMRSHNVTLNCNICGEGFTSKTKFESHLKTSHFEENKQQQSGFMCSECGKVYSRITNCSRHMNICNKQKRYQCANCDKAFTRKKDFDNHLKVHGKKRPFVCSKCGNRFKVLEGLRIHMLTHTKKRNFSCDKCTKTFKTRRELSQHRAIHEKRILMCEICGRTFLTPRYLNRHLKGHQKEVSVPPPTTTCKLDPSIFSCEHCGDIFKNKQRLQTHQRIHEGDRKFKCQLCNASFDKKQQFTLHMKRHEERMKQKESEVDKTSPANGRPNGNENVGVEMGESITPQATNVLEPKIPPPLIQCQEVEEDYVHDSATKQNTLPSFREAFPHVAWKFGNNLDKYM